MDTRNISNEILEIRSRLADLEREFEDLAGSDPVRSKLEDEERRLRQRLGALHDQLSAGEEHPDRRRPGPDEPLDIMPEIPPV